MINTTNQYSNNINFKYYSIAICLFVYLFICLFPIPTVFAQSPTPEDSAASAIKGIRDVVKEKVKEQLEVLNTETKKGYVGKLSAISATQLTLETNEGNLKIKIDDDTTIIGLNRSPIKIENLKADQYVIAMGYLELEDTLSAKRIVVIEKLSTLEKEIAVGKITDISKDGKTVTLKNESKAKTYTLNIGKSITVTQKGQKGELEKLAVEDLQKGDVVICVGTPDKTNEKILNVYMIHLLSKSLGLPTPKASVSPAGN